MARRSHNFSAQTIDAARTLGLQIAAGRRARHWIAAELAERAGVSRATVRSAERGAPTVTTGVMFELATLVGVQLFSLTEPQIARHTALEASYPALLPARIRASSDAAEIRDS